MDCTWDAALLQHGDRLPDELLQVIRHGTDEQYLQTFTRAAMDARYTYTLLAHCEHLLPNICASLRSQGSFPSTISTLGRIIPFAPYLTPYATEILERECYDLGSDETDEDLVYLLGLFRLLRHNHRVFRRYVPVHDLSATLGRSSRPATYLAIRILQLYLEGADHWFEETVGHFFGDDQPDEGIEGTWDDSIIDYRFLSLWEADQHKNVLQTIHDARHIAQDPTPTHCRQIRIDLLHPSVLLVAGVSLPRMDSPSKSASARMSQLVHTPTATTNLRSVAEALKSPGPILLQGIAGSGKTMTAHHIAAALGKIDNMITLHLNEQSDAKLLLGVYTTGDTPGTFLWKPGVLTTAVQDGRWVMIEDLDRAPNEVVGTLLPLIEGGELLLPNRQETLHAAEGFRILASVRTSTSPHGEQTSPLVHMLGIRHWTIVNISMPSTTELVSVTQALFPRLGQLLPQFMAVYQRLLKASKQLSPADQGKTGTIRMITPRDLLKWCERTSSLLDDRSNFTSKDRDDLYLEAIDCFVGALPDSPLRKSLTAAIAEELHIDPQRRDHVLFDRDVQHKVEKSTLRVGRYVFERARQKTRQNDHFSTNSHTLRMLERVAAAVTNHEPLLLVGETGVGKTTAVQHLASTLGKILVPFNLSQQSEVGDLLGGFKPVNVRSLIIPMKDEFDDLFGESFSTSKNEHFMEMLNKQIFKSNWRAVCKLWRQALSMVSQQRSVTPPPRQGETPSKKRKVGAGRMIDFARWDQFGARVATIEQKLSAGNDAVAFAFVEGNIVKALRSGDWVLLDEINLASPDTLESIVSLFDGDLPSLLLTEAGNVERIYAHPEFRIIAAMNPATDVGKKDLPAGIRSRFTELYVDSPDKDPKALQSIVRAYLRHESTSDLAIPADVSMLYHQIVGLADGNRLVDGAGQKPHFSLRTLTRTLVYARSIQQNCSLRRALYEGFQMSFLTFLDSESCSLVEPLIEEGLFGKRTNHRSELRKALRKPMDGHQYAQGHPNSKHWIRQGKVAVDHQPHYIITPFVERNLENLVRAASSRQFPILIQGPTSSGKTSMIEYLARRTGHQFVRINNHEHTDLQEYLGTYVSGVDGQLMFQDGILSKALREGHWLVLDELNLAPSDVLEALNRLLDDNRELLIPETQEVIRPHPDFMIFATQNPAGLYGGRKTLSRAFRNRFLELHFDDIPISELQEILHRRTLLPEKWCKRIVATYKELSILRQENRVFEQKSFATLRDLFRWAQRQNDTIQQLAANGYMLLCERVRKPEEQKAIKRTLEKVMSSQGPRVEIDEELLYAHSCPELTQHNASVSDSDIVWTRAMRRLYVLVTRALDKNEPVLLVGETGCGKTTVCQMLASAFRQLLHILNAHQNTETGDLIGSQRPVRDRSGIELSLRESLLNVLFTNEEEKDSLSTEGLLQTYDAFVAAMDKKQRILHTQGTLHTQIQTARTRFKALFEWVDGSLVKAMKHGELFLLDEISLADDSVLERLNSVLEPQRTILLAEKGSVDSFVTAVPGFQFLATMNPGGDYGKRELSPALRNRFTEIWVPALSDLDEISQIVRAKLVELAQPYAQALVHFAAWFKSRYDISATSSVSIRDTLAWVSFINTFAPVRVEAAVVHGAAMVYIDTLGANPAGLLSVATRDIESERAKCLQELGRYIALDATRIYNDIGDPYSNPTAFGIGPFSISRSVAVDNLPSDFTFDAPTTKLNTMRVLRALQVSKPIMLEGSPGVGKTALVTAIASAANMPLTRINLSDQTDLLDLFGSDAPVEGANTGTFAWRDAPFLRAMKNGDWVLLDEMNLASQPVLEGLNACLDHRGEVFVPELGRTFRKHKHFRIFAAQNPHHQGGGRKGLPASFVNRFTVVYADSFRAIDLHHICRRVFPSVQAGYIEQAVSFVDRLGDAVTDSQHLGTNGGPWEFNLRDIARWMTLASSQGLYQAGSPRDFADMLFAQRFRTVGDRACLDTVFKSVFGDFPECDRTCNVSPLSVQVGLALLPRNKFDAAPAKLRLGPSLSADHLKQLSSMMICVDKAWPVILSGPPGVGKTSLIQMLAAHVGTRVTTLAMSAETDVLDLIGGFEQLDRHRQRAQAYSAAMKWTRGAVKAGLTRTLPSEMLDLLQLLEDNESSSVDVGQLLILVDKLPGEIKRDLLPVLNDLNIMQEVDEARFEWINGPLIQALEQGTWLILDNANLCSPAVLDRLNSLLEPNGALMVNEHSNADGQPEILHPHPNFRIFLTVNPRLGELSRAMRNRAVELYMLPPELKSPSVVAGLSTESAMARFHLLEAVAEQQSPANADVLAVAGDHFSLSDRTLIPRLQRQLQHGLFRPKARITDSYASLSGEMSLTPRSTSQLEAFYRDVTSFHLASADLACVQTFHPLNNQALMQLSRYCFQRALSFAALHEFHASLTYLLKAVTLAKSDRMISDRLLRFTRQHFRDPKDVHARRTGNLAGLEQIISIIGSLSPHILEVHVDQLSMLKTAAHTSLSFCWRLLQAVTCEQINIVELRALAEIGQSIGSSLEEGSVPSLRSIGVPFVNALAVFLPLPALSNLHSFIALWSHLRPRVPSSMDQLDALLEFEKVMSDFDHRSWTFTMPIFQVVDVRIAFQEALELGITQGTDLHLLSEQVQSSLSGLQGQQQGVSAVLKIPHFELAFEYLCQHFAILKLQGDLLNRSEYVQLELFAMRPTHRYITDDTLAHSLSPQRALQSLELSLPNGFTNVATTRSINTTIAVEILERLERTDQIDLDHLALFETEREALGRILASKTHLFAKEHSVAVDSCLRDLLRAVLQTSAASNTTSPFKEFARLLLAALDSNDSSAPLDDMLWSAGVVTHSQSETMSRFHKVGQYLRLTQDARRRSPKESSLAWLNLALACVDLYVLSHPYDPVQEAQVRRSVHEHMKVELTGRLNSLRVLREAWTGQTDSIRARVLEEDIAALGPRPDELNICRPQTSLLMQVFSEMQTLMRVLEPLRVSEASQLSSAMLDKTVWQNLHDLRERLSSDRYRAYADITAPVSGFIDCLRVGHRYASLADSTSAAESPSGPLASITPLGDATLADWLCDESFMRALHDCQSQHQQLQWLALVAARSAVIPTSQTSHALRSDIDKVFQRFYTAWTNELQRDQRTAAAKSSLYRYRDDSETQEDAAFEEAMNELFPSFESPNIFGQARSLTAHDGQALAPKLAALFHDMHCPTTPNPQTLIDLVKDGARVAVSQPMMNNLPAIMLLLANHASGFSPSGLNVSKSDIYSEANVDQAKTLVKLVIKIRTHFLSIQQTFPESTLPTDVLAECDKILKVGHAEPLPKLFPYVEQLHDKTTEWQKVASSQYSVTDLIEEILGLVVTWRRMELSSWSTLFDREDRACEQSAKSWWYIAYEAIVEANLGIDTKIESMERFACSLTETLGSFLVNCGLGEFTVRVDMLRDFSRYMDLRSCLERHVSIISNSIKNVIAYHSAFQERIREKLVKRREELNKEVRDIIQLFAWKTRNIRDMRMNAKASHKKLFRVVRKYRRLLSEPVASHLLGDYPSVPVGDQYAKRAVTYTLEHPGGQSRDIEPLVQVYTPGNGAQRRLTLDMPAVAQMLRSKAGTVKKYDLVARRIANFLDEVQQESLELRKATPATSTEANKALISHLKKRKRRLLADVLREVQLMGFKTGLGEDILASQRSLYTVLARSSSPLAQFCTVSNVDLVDEEFYRMLHVMQSVRDCATKHSEDLTPNEVKRCVTLLESMLYTSINQRATLDIQLAAYAKFKAGLDVLVRLGECQQLLPRWNAMNAFSTFKAGVISMSNIVQAGLQCVEVQSSLSGTQYPSLSDSLTRQLENIQSLREDVCHDGIALPGLSDHRLRTLEERHKNVVADIEAIVSQGLTAHPELQAVLTCILRFTAGSSLDGGQTSEKTDQPSTMTIEAWSEALLTMVDKIAEDHGRESDVTGLSLPGTKLAWLIEAQNYLTHRIGNLGLQSKSDQLYRLLHRLSQLSPENSSRCADLAGTSRLVHPLLQGFGTLAQQDIHDLLALHEKTTIMTHRLGASFAQLAREGFCAPSEKPASDDKQSGEAQAGTGLGDGEGAEDISKDVGDDEDLSELAQEAKSKSDEQELESEKDAVDMADEDLNGEFDKGGESNEEQLSDEENGFEDDIDEEVSEAVNTDPSRIDEKQWDSKEQDAQQDEENKDGKGLKADEIAAASQDQAGENDEQGDQASDMDPTGEDLFVGEDDNFDAQPSVPEQADPHMQQDENLELPEDLTMDDDGSALSEDNELEPDLEDMGVDEDEATADNKPGADIEMEQEEGKGEAEEEMDPSNVHEQAQDDEVQDDNMSDVAMLESKQEQREAEDQQASGDDGQGHERSDKEARKVPMDQESRDIGDDTETASQPGDGEGRSGPQHDERNAQRESASVEQQQQSEAFKSLGDVLRQWYNQHRDLGAAQEIPDEEAAADRQRPIDDRQFEHIPNHAESEIQALGAASAEQSQALNEDYAMSVNEDEEDARPQPDMPTTPPGQANNGEADGGTHVAEGDKMPPDHQKSMVGPKTDDFVNDTYETVGPMIPDDMNDVDQRMTDTHLFARPETNSLTIDEARRQWSEHEGRTRNMAVVLTEHLRLILQPTQATKMRGDFRTGKRLNIKKIIPYIASSYKRDKIWMRRSVPSKRSYQVMLALDDSESMTERQSKDLAFDTLALVAKSMSMLEVGEISILGFGESVNVAHDFNVPFTADAGGEVLRQFTFTQSKTDVRRLLERSIDIFRNARLKATGSASDLWQLQLIISDGDCEDHPTIRRLVRMAHEEQIMVVFVVIDAAAQISEGSEQSIVDLQRAEFTKDANGELQVDMVKYLETFPFRYYLIVRDVNELPGVLAAALRQWFAEVVGAGG